MGEFVEATGYIATDLWNILPLEDNGFGLFRTAEPPWIIGGLAFIWGFFSSYFKRSVVRVPDLELVRYLRREQLYRLFHGNRLPPEGDADE